MLTKLVIDEVHGLVMRKYRIYVNLVEWV